MTDSLQVGIPSRSRPTTSSSAISTTSIIDQELCSLRIELSKARRLLKKRSVECEQLRWQLERLQLHCAANHTERATENLNKLDISHAKEWAGVESSKHKKEGIFKVLVGKKRVSLPAPAS